jgi:hypothetical protein
MRIENYVNYGMCIYDNVLSPQDAYQLGDVVINRQNEVGVIIQIHSPEEFRTDMFGNSCTHGVRFATDEEIGKYRPFILTQGHFKHD